jgi:uncharacterized membrane protein YhaH (DUF805 family)
MARDLSLAGMRMELGLSAWRRTFDVRGRATRTEALCFLLATWLIGVALAASVALAWALGMIDVPRAPSPVWSVRNLVGTAITFLPVVPCFALLARRLHDIGMPGWPAFPLMGLIATLGLWRGLAAPGNLALNPLPAGLEAVRIAGVLCLCAVLIWPPRPGANRHGDDPRDAAPEMPAPAPA